MKRIKLTLMALLATLGLQAANTVEETAQVTSGVSLTTDVDYVITDATPFTTAGSVNIVNTDHAVLIFKNIKPSKVISHHMGNIFINGEAAKNGTNCQVRMYANGAVVLPYGNNCNPLTCYTEENFQGDSYNNYSMGHSGGYMNTMSATQLNNKVRSFKLKRGYMVTFAVGVSGWGYSRCFIADKADLEITSVPAPLNGKISSYRIFKWWNAPKQGLASDTRLEANQKLNSAWCYDWATGWDMGPDVECVPNHIYEDWPSSSACGSVTYSCHMKTNNEPGNSADDHPQSVDEVLNNWQNLMRTGMRLCSESSHDGSMGHLRDFMDSIDARGWRCDILDLHCYWPSGNFNSLTWYSDEYGHGRPIWISEWVWGASWNNNGIFASQYKRDDFWSSTNQEANYNGTKPILETLNANARVERHAYWNREADCSKILKDGILSKLGQYYAQMETGLGYNPANEFVPKIVYKAPSELLMDYTKRTNIVKLTWSDSNGDMIDSILVEHKAPGSSLWKKMGNVKPQDMNGKNGANYSYEHQPEDIGIHYYRVTEYYNNKKKFTTNEATLTIAAAKNVGSLQYGQLSIASTETVTTDIESQEKAPYVVAGLVSNRNTKNGITNRISSLGKSSFSLSLYPWQLKEPVEISKSENVDYMILPPDTIFHLGNDMMLISQKAGSIGATETEVTFPQPFPEGITPVVVAQQNTSISAYAPVTVRVYDVTNTGFKITLTRQEGANISLTAQKQNVNYFACSPGQAAIGEGKMLTVGRNDINPVGRTTARLVTLFDRQGDTLFLQNPYIIAAPQTKNYEKTSVFRQTALETTDKGVCGFNVRRQDDPTSTSTISTSLDNGDYMGWFIISNDPNGTGDEQPAITPTAISQIKPWDMGYSISNRIITTNDPSARIYNTGGQEVSAGAKLSPGIYFITTNNQTRKVVVK